MCPCMTYVQSKKLNIPVHLSSCLMTNVDNNKTAQIIHQGFNKCVSLVCAWQPILVVMHSRPATGHDYSVNYVGNKLNCFISARKMLSFILHCARVFFLFFFVDFDMLQNDLFKEKYTLCTVGSSTQIGCFYFRGC